MSLNGATVWEVRPGGSDTICGGGFNPANANFPTDGTTDTNTGNTSAPVFSSASYNFVASDVDAWIYIKQGTNSLPGWYKVVSVASNKATLSAAIGTAVLAINNGPQALNTVVGIATVGTPTNLTWGLDYSQQNAANIAFTDMVIDGTTNTKFTSAANPVGKNFIGNLIRITGGSGFTVQYVEVVSTATTTATCDKSLGTLSSTGGTGNLGGAFATLMPFTSTKPEFVSGFTILIAAGTYVHTSQPVIQTTFVLIGYDTIRCDFAARPVLQTTVNSYIVGTNGQSPYIAEAVNIDFDGNNVSGTSAMQRVSGTAAFGYAYYNCILRRMGLAGQIVPASISGNLFNCLVHSNAGGGAEASQVPIYAWNSTFRDNGGAGIGNASSNGQVIAVKCVFARNLYGINAYSVSVDNCLFHSNTSHAIVASIAQIATQPVAFRNSIIWANLGWGIATSVIPAGVANVVGAYWFNVGDFYYIAAGSNSSGNYQNLRPPVLGDIALTADPCVDAAGNNFSLNNVPGGGALCRGAGYPGVLNGGSIGFVDIGPLQHRDFSPRARSAIGV